MRKNRRSRRNLFLRFGFDHFAPPKAQPMEHLRHGPRRGAWLRALAAGCQGFPRRLGCQPRGGQRGTQRRGLLCVGFGKLAEDCRDLGRLIFPTLAAAAGRLGPQTHDAWASLGQPERHGLSSPPQDRFRLQGIPLAVFQGHLRLQRSSCRSGHCGGGQA